MFFVDFDFFSEIGEVVEAGLRFVFGGFFSGALGGGAGFLLSDEGA